MNRKFSFALAAALSLSLTSLALAGPSDIVPRGDATYDLLGSLASAGRLSGYTLRDFARGDRLYTREEIARLLIANRDRLDEGNAGAPFAIARRALYMTFAPDMKRLGVVVNPNSAPPAQNAEVYGSIKARLLTEPLQGTFTVRGAAAAPVGRDGIALLEAGNWREEWYRDTPSASTAAGNLAKRNYSAVETALYRVNGRFLDVSIGRQPLRIGPGYTGGLLISDESDSIPQIKIEKEFRLWGNFGRSLGPLYFSQVYGQFFEDNDPTAVQNAQGTRRHLAVRRLETNGTGRGHFSVTEAFKSTRLPDAWVPQVFPYYLYQNDWTTESRRNTIGWLATTRQPNTNWCNYWLDVAGSYRLDGRGTLVYVDYALDDVKAPLGLRRSNQETPRKLAQQYGIYLPNLGGVNRFGLRLEYSNSDRDAYTNISPPIAWDQRDVALGNPLGPNARLFFVRADAKVSDKLSVSVEGQTRRRGVAVEDRVEPKSDRAAVYATYALQNNAFAGLRLEHQKVSFYNLPGNRNDTRLDANLGWGF